MPTYEELAYDSFVRARQGSAPVEDFGNAPMGGEDFEFDPRILRLITSADHFFLGTTTGHGWPYIQHRGGPAGFVRHLGGTRVAWAEYSGNNQFVSHGNVDRDGRVCMFFINYATRERIKVFGNAHLVEPEDDPTLLQQVLDLGDRVIKAKVLRIMVVDVIAVDSNCTKNIHPRYTRADVEERIDLYRADIKELREEVAELRKQLEGQGQ